MANKDKSGCLGCFGMMFLAFIGLAILGRMDDNGRKSNNRQQEINNGEQKTARAELLETELRPFVNHEGKRFQMLYVRWKNTGNVPIRVVDANMKVYDSTGNLINVYDYSLYAEFDSNEGIAPGETYIDPEDEGFIIPELNAKRVDVTLTKVSSTSGL